MTLGHSIPIHTHTHTHIAIYENITKYNICGCTTATVNKKYFALISKIIRGNKERGKEGIQKNMRASVILTKFKITCEFKIENNTETLLKVK